MNSPQLPRALALLALSVAGATRARAQAFSGEVHAGAGGAIEIADLDSDGRNDVLLGSVTTGGHRRLVTRLGNGDGTLQPPLYSPLAAAALELDLVDWNGDGKLDALCSAPQGLQLGNGDGQGKFGGVATVALSPGAGLFAVLNDLCTGDFDGDGRIDACAASELQQSFWFVRNDTHGGFSAPAAIYGGRVPFELASADVDLDGALDVLLGTVDHGKSAVTVMRGDGAGGFGSPVDYPSAFALTAFTSGDINGDGSLDVITFGYTSQCTRKLGDGAGGFAAGTKLDIPYTAYDVALADVTHDGVLDLAWAGRTEDRVGLWTGSGDGTFHSPAITPPGMSAQHIAIGDLSDDGDADVACSGSDMRVFFGDGEGGLGLRSIPFAPNTSGYAVGDIDVDGHADLVAMLGTKLATLHGDGLGGFEPPITNTLPGSVSGPPRGNTPVGDMDGDGKLDLVGYALFSTIVLLGDGQAHFPTLYSYPLPSEAAALGDVDADGDLDVYSVSGGFLAPTGVALWTNDGAAYLSASTTLPLSLFGNPTIATGDVDVDGLADCVVNTLSGGSVGVLLAAGGGTLGPLSPLSAGDPFVVEAAIADATHDGIPDAILLSTQTSSTVTPHIAIAPGHGDGTFGAPSQIKLGSVPTTLALGAALALGDFGGDGDLDIAVPLTTSSFIEVVAGTNAGFESPRRVQTVNSPYGLHVADLDSDGRQDLVTLSRVAHVFQTHSGAYSPPNAASAYGSGTPDCLGAIGLSAKLVSPSAGGGVSIAAANVPESSFGWLLVGAAADAAGSDVLGLGALLHVDVLGGAAFAIAAFPSDATGAAQRTVPLPASGSGLGMYAQGVWLAHVPCAHDVVSSKGLAFVLAP